MYMHMCIIHYGENIVPALVSRNNIKVLTLENAGDKTEAFARRRNRLRRRSSHKEEPEEDEREDATQPSHNYS